MNTKGGTRVQNCGEKGVERWIEIIGDVLGKRTSDYTSHCFRRSAATTLADNGSTMTNLKRHGRWSSDSCAEGYIDNSRKLKLERLTLLGDELSESAASNASKRKKS